MIYFERKSKVEKLKIFISYSHKDKDLAHKFYDHLSKCGFEIIWDENVIITGDNFDKKLKKSLLDADVYLPIITDNFEKSSFTRSEFLTAIGYNYGRERPKIFPYISQGGKIPQDISTLLCFMGTDNIEQDLVEIENQLNKLKGSIFAEEDINNELSENINGSLDEYLTDVFSKLERNEKVNRILAYIAYAISALFLISIIPFIVYRSKGFNYADAQVTACIVFVIQNISILTVLAALSRLSFILGKSFMVESIRNGDRFHAISFGKFYIRAYGNRASRQEVREVLGEWNIDKGSSFSTQDVKEIDPNFLGSLDLLKAYFERNK